MFHWSSISDDSPHNWRFSIKASDRVVADRIPVLELHVQTQERQTYVFHDMIGNVHNVEGAPRFGEIHIFHQSNDENNAYLEHMFDNNNLTMELIPNLATDSANVFANVFANVHISSINCYPMGAMEILETKWVFSSNQDRDQMQNTVSVDEGGILGYILDADPTELITMENSLNGWDSVETKEVQKLDWKQFGF